MIHFSQRPRIRFTHPPHLFHSCQCSYLGRRHHRSYGHAQSSRNGPSSFRSGRRPQSVPVTFRCLQDVTLLNWAFIIYQLIISTIYYNHIIVYLRLASWAGALQRLGVECFADTAAPRRLYFQPPHPARSCGHLCYCSYLLLQLFCSEEREIAWPV